MSEPSKTELHGKVQNLFSKNFSTWKVIFIAIFISIVCSIMQFKDADTGMELCRVTGLNFTLAFAAFLIAMIYSDRLNQRIIAQQQEIEELKTRLAALEQGRLEKQDD